MLKFWNRKKNFTSHRRTQKEREKSERDGMEEEKMVEKRLYDLSCNLVHWFSASRLASVNTSEEKKNDMS